MDANTLVALLAGILAHAIAATGGTAGSMPGLTATLTQYLILAAHGVGLTGGCNPASYVNGVLVGCTGWGNVAWLDIPASLQPVALEVARLLSWLLFPVGA